MNTGISPKSTSRPRVEVCIGQKTPRRANRAGRAAAGTRPAACGTPAPAGAKVAIAVNGANLRNGGTATLNAGASNTITATVTQGNAVRVYTVTVTGAAG